MNSCLLKISLFLLLSASSFADATLNSAITWDEKFYQSLKPSYQSKLTAFGEEILKQLPRAMTQSLHGRVVIGFKSLDSSVVLTPPSCLDADRMANLLQQKIEAEFNGIKTNSTDIGSASQNPPVYGETIEPKKKYQTFRINLNHNFLVTILKGPMYAQTYSCGHKNLYRLAQATVVHELSHVYDALNITALNNPKERELRSQCAGAVGPVPVGQMPVFCRDLVDQTKSVSDRPVWKNLMNWNRGLFVSKTKNFLALRSPDPYEKINLSEAFAVNMEYFVLDPEFSCRRPEVDSFFRGHFNISTDEKPLCLPNTVVRFSSSRKQLNLDLSRLYEVHYLMAAKGQSLESRFGHAMLRMVFCSPKRVAPGPECLQDTDQHVVISFRANISGINQNYWSGITGGYPSQMFLYTMPETISEYTVSEFRDLISLPLKLTPAEKKRFVERVLQEYWEYQGRYYFINNNCATETLDFLKGVIFRNTVLKKVSTIETPQGLFNFLSENDLLDAKVLNDLHKEGRYYFSSYKKVISKALQQIDRGQNIPDSIEIFAETFGPQKRRDLYNQITKKLYTTTEKKNLAIQFYRLERAISYYIDEQRKRLAETVIAKNGNTGHISNDYRENILKIIILRSRLSPWFLAKNGYGIPLSVETKTDSELEQEHKQAFEASLKIDEGLRRDFPDVDRGIKEVNSNLLYFFNEIKRSVGELNPQP